MDRRDFLALNAASLAGAFTGLDLPKTAAAGVTASGATDDPPLVDVDFQALVSRSDIVYHSPVEKPVEGQPIGNGRMGTMVWTTPSRLCFQLNRVDVFSVNRNHIGQWNDMGKYPPPQPDFCGACASLELDVGGTPFARGEPFRQQLSLYTAESHVQGDGVDARCFVPAGTDVLIIEIDDRRPAPPPLRLTLSLWGARTVQHEDHVASFAFFDTDDTPGVMRTFTERDYYCSSAVACRPATGQVTATETTETTRTFVITRPSSGKLVIHVATAASMSKAVDLVSQVNGLLTRTIRRPTEATRTAHRAWWADFWARSFVHLTSADGTADFMERLRTIYLYIMASSCQDKGAIAPKWNGMLFSTEGDVRAWGTHYWGWTMETLYSPLMAAGASDLTDSYFNMYVAQLPRCRVAARQWWGAKGAFIPEVSPFDGPPEFPEDVAEEFRRALQPEPRTAEFSPRAKALSLFEPQIRSLVWLGEYFNAMSHLFSAGATIAAQAWWRFRSTGDTKWLRSHAYPLLRDSAEFYRTIVRRGTDGKYHIELTNAHESYLYIKDSILDLAAIRGIVPLALRASEILGVDAGLRAGWHDLLAGLTPYPLGGDPDAFSSIGVGVWAPGRNRDGAYAHRFDEDVSIYPVFPFEYHTLESDDPATTRLVHDLAEVLPVRRAVLDKISHSDTAARTPVFVARIGRGEELPAILAGYYPRFDETLPNGFSLFEGQQAHSVEHVGVMAMAIQEGLVQSLSASPGQPEAIRIGPAWPKAWEATFSLIARGGFAVTARIRNGTVDFVEIESRLGEPCRIHNPWTTPCVVVEVGKPRQQRRVDGLIEFPTRAGKRYRLFMEKPPATVRIAPTTSADVLYIQTP